MTRKDLIAVSNIIGKAKLSKMSSAQRAEFSRAMRPIRALTREFEQVQKDTAEDLRPDGFDAVINEVQSLMGKTAEEQMQITSEDREKADAVHAYNAYNIDVEMALRDWMSAEAEEGARMSEEAFDALVESNDFTAEELFALEDVLLTTEGDDK